jgi:hypothetical protein
VGGQALIWFGIAGGAAVAAVTLLYNRYVRRTPQAVRAGGSFALFAGILFLFALGAAAAGMAAVAAGR